ncbi:MAG: AAA family ATPase [Candidatus Eisenbacteria sp.]|nr:AAA family ATPase [Candidatus Eisenbacteria bacterium]
MYCSFFKFTERPFNMTPDPRFLFMSRTHTEALAHLLYGIRHRKGFVALVGEVGTGKTTLIHTLLDEIADDTRVAIVSGGSFTLGPFLRMVLDDLGVPYSGRSAADMMIHLKTFLIEQARQGTNVALIIDEAQAMAPSLLEHVRMLSNMETSREKLMQIVLVGQLELGRILSRPELRQLAQRIGLRCRIDPLAPDEIARYVRHRLTVAGAGDREILTEEALDIVSRHSGGIPRVANILCDGALLDCYARSLHRVDAEVMNATVREWEEAITVDVPRVSMRAAAHL